MKKMGKYVPTVMLYIVCINWTVMDVLICNSVIIIHCIRKTVLSADNLSVYIVKYVS